MIRLQVLCTLENWRSCWKGVKGPATNSGFLQYDWPSCRKNRNSRHREQSSATWCHASFCSCTRTVREGRTLLKRISIAEWLSLLPASIEYLPRSRTVRAEAAEKNAHKDNGCNSVFPTRSTPQCAGANGVKTPHLLEQLRADHGGVHGVRNGRRRFGRGCGRRRARSSTRCTVRIGRGR